MKQFYAFTAIAVFLSLQAAAQFTQNFDAVTALTTGCNTTFNSDRTTVTGEVINGTGSLFSNPPVNGSGTRDYATPYLNVINPSDPLAASTDITISFNYKLNEQLNGQAVRTIEVGLQSPSGFISLSTISMNKDNDPIVSTPFSGTFTVPVGVYRVALRMGGSQGNGSVRIIIDDLVVSANPYYSVGGTCNLAPVTNNDFYFTNTYAPTLFASVLANDLENNGETLGVPTVTTPSPDGTVVFNNDGSFTFTPNVGFTGTSTTFTYTVYDNGYDPAGSTATVTINFTSNSPLPVRMISFTGNINNSIANLNWTVAENETGHNFVLEKSTDGRTFGFVAMIMNTTRTGNESYAFNTELTDAVTYFRLKILNRNNTVSYSGIIRLSMVSRSNLQLLQNPVTSGLSFQYESAVAGPAQYTIYTVTGAKVYTSSVQIQKGVNIIQADQAYRLVKGSYILEFVSGSERMTTKFIKQ